MWNECAWFNHKLESRFQGEINNLRYADDTTLMAESKEVLKSLLMNVKEESEKAGLKTFKKQISWHPVTSLHGKYMGKQWKEWQTFYFLGSKITADGDFSYEIKKLSLL